MMKPVRSAWASLACACVVVHGAANAENGDWHLRLGKREKLTYHGVINGDLTGQPGMMMYPAPNLAGFLAGVAVHGLINSSSRDNAQEKAEKAADAVLQPFRSELDKFTPNDLALAALERNRFGFGSLLSQGAESAGTIVDIAPVFFLTQERDALVLENPVVITPPSGKVYQMIVRVVSDRRNAEDLAAHWGADQARELKATSAQLLARSLEIALEDARKSEAEAAPAPYHTLRYVQGKHEVVERAQLLDEHCGRILIRTLRGGLTSAPASKPFAGEDAACRDSAQF